PPLTPAIYTLSLHDALPILHAVGEYQPLRRFLLRQFLAAYCLLNHACHQERQSVMNVPRDRKTGQLIIGMHYCFLDKTNLKQPTDRKSTRLNSSHVKISYAV